MIEAWDYIMGDEHTVGDKVMFYSVGILVFEQRSWWIDIQADVFYFKDSEGSRVSIHRPEFKAADHIREILEVFENVA